MPPRDRQPSRVIGPDGFARSETAHASLDDLALATFGSGAGAEFLRYLRSITIEAVGGPEITDAQLRHREGARYLVAIIEQRVAAAQERRKKA